MEPFISISQLNMDHNYLNFHLHGKLNHCAQRDKVRIILLFYHSNENRRIPLNITYTFSKQNTLQGEFESDAKIHLPSVFYQKEKFKACTMNIILANGYEELEFTKVHTDQIVGIKGVSFDPAGLKLEGYLFEKPNVSKTKPIDLAYKLLLFAYCILLFPLLLINGMKKNKSLKQALRYVSSRTEKISGISYSKRLWKTYYFRHCYNRRIRIPIDSKQVVFLSERRLDKSGNLYLVMEDLKFYKEMDILLLQQEATISDLSFHKLNQIAGALATARIIVLDDFYPQLHALNIRKETEVVQLWHACGAFKTFGFSRIGKQGGAPQQSLNHRNYDYVFVSGERIRSIYSEAFGVPIEYIRALGVPRTDVFFSKQYQQKVQETLYRKYPNLQQKKVVLIAPTFRGNGNRDAYYPVDRLSINQLCSQLPPNYIFIIKMHPFVKDKFVIDDCYKNRVLDLSLEENINDLLFVTDILVTDYSSVIFEAALLNLPMVFYSFDLEEYKNTRDVYYDYEHFVPGPIVFTQDQLCLSLLEAGGEPEKTQFFKDYFLDALDGNSTQRITEFIYHLI